tara:strand:+ start:2912 stop:3205 length:294 start_codon:yes stop_codon:yes gene_type:complete
MKLTKLKLKQIIKEELNKMKWERGPESPEEIIDDAAVRSAKPDVIRQALELAHEALTAGKPVASLGAYIMNNMPDVEFDMYDENLINDAIKLLQRNA